jgi:DNA mismatch repair ATPase MutS
MMRIDAVTARDLELDRVRESLDRTRTRAGSEALRRRFAEPLSDAGDIRDVQGALEALAAMEHPVRPDDRIIEAARRYVQSNVVLARGSRLRTWVSEGWYRVRYADIVRELAGGRDAVRLLWRMASGTAERLRTEGAPRLLTDLADRIDGHANTLRSILTLRPLLWVDRQLRGEARDVVLELLELLGDVDALQAMALVGSEAGWCRPEVIEDEGVWIEAEDVVHPLLPRAAPNPIRLGGEVPLVFLTGPNMAGKTTYLRTVALAVYLAQLGLHVPARAMRFAPARSLFTSLNPVDDLREGVSYFYAEVLRVKEAATLLATGEPTLVLFDEVFRGTNLKDALEASAHVIRGFADARNGASIFSSHLSELSDVLAEHPAVRFRRFTGAMEDGRPVFDFRIEDGVSDQRFGMLLLRHARVPELIARLRT